MSGTTEVNSFSYAAGRAAAEQIRKGVYEVDDSQPPKDLLCHAEPQLVETPASPPWVFAYIYISFFGVCGCFLRIGVDETFGNVLFIEKSAGLINLSFFSNLMGCFVAGILEGSLSNQWNMVSLCNGLVVGFCGTLTSWSNWNQALSLILIGETSVDGQAQVTVIASLLISFYGFYGVYGSGLDVGNKLGPKLQGKLCRKQMIFTDVFVTLSLVVVIFVIVISLLLDISTAWKSYFAAAAIAPLGACLRGRLYRCKMDKCKLSLGTFLANLIGTVIVAFIHVLLTHAPATCGPSNQCWTNAVTFAVTEGFCGALTTVSILISEVYHIRNANKQFSFAYICLSVIIWQFLSGVINGVNFLVKSKNATSFLYATESPPC